MSYILMKKTQPKASMGTVKKELGSGSLLPNGKFETSVFKYQNKEQGTMSRYPVRVSLLAIYRFQISETFTEIRNKELLPGSRFSVSY